jgi:DNA-binding NtrC family response regulator
MAESARVDERREARILVVEDNDALRRGICMALSEHWSVVEDENNGESAVARLRDRRRPPYQVVVTDLRLPGADGLQVLRAAQARDESTSVIVMTAYGSIDTAVEAMRLGAFDFLQKPFDLAHLELRVSRASETARRGDSEVEALDENAPGLRDVIVESAAMKEAVDLVRRVADTRSTVLITGETGTGKEIIAGLVHSLSVRANESFVKVNCAAVPETLLESELFGHERGAFTGADRQRIGRFEQASGGTLFLDEIGDVSLATQAKLLRVLQDQEFYRLGGTRALRTDARIVTATNRDLAEAKQRGEFREDLYFRLDVIGIHLKPLRERPEDLRALCGRFLEELAQELDRPVLALSEAAWARLLAHRWPGNIRELRNAIERAVLTCGGEGIDAPDLDLAEHSARPGAPGWRPEIPDDGISLRDVERDLVVAALERTGHVQKDAAALLHVSRRKLNYMIQRMGLTHPSWRRNRSTKQG